MTKRRAAKLNIKHRGFEKDTGFNCGECSLRHICTARGNFVYYYDGDRRADCVNFCKRYLSK